MILLKRIALAVMLSCFSESAIAQQTPPPAQPPAAAPSTHTEAWWNSKYGEADTIGALNNLSPKGVKDAAKLVKTGRVYALGVPTGPDTPAYGNRKITIERTPGPGSNFTPDGSQRVTSFDEKVTTSMGIGTQIDGLAHLGVDHHYYNGIEGKDIAGSYKLDLASIPPIVTRGVLIDMTKHYKKPMLEVGDMYNKAEIVAAAKAQKITIKKGDVVIFHTNWIEKAASDKDLYRSREPGFGEEGAQYLADLGVVAVGSDTIALEALPSPPGKTFIVHQTLLAKNGVHIFESLDTRELARDGASEFLFVLGAPRIQGTVQMVINPVAIR
jgi:kynurenine formamidase